jgi:ADP-heptose:LPS heptosyltransferase
MNANAQNPNPIPASSSRESASIRGSELPLTVRPEKILALQFKYFGDAVLLTPALRALRAHFPQAELHLLAPSEVAPLFEHLPWLTRVWPMPRRRGRASLGETWPLIRALRRERFDRSVDFAGNDRGAILSFFIGAKVRLGWEQGGGFLGRRFCYTGRVALRDDAAHESARMARLLSGWNVPPPDSLEPEVRPDPALAGKAKKILPHDNAVLCHVASSQPRKEWPLAYWNELQKLVAPTGRRVVFTTPLGAREAGLMAELQKIMPAAEVLPAISDLPLFLAVLARARAFVSGDTGPLHFAAGLGVPTVSLFGPTSSARWGPIGPRHQILNAGTCVCEQNSAVCSAPRHCLADILPAQAAAALRAVLHI